MIAARTAGEVAPRFVGFRPFVIKLPWSRKVTRFRRATRPVGVIEMELFCWILAGFCAYSGLSVVASVGKPRRPLTSGTAAVVVAFSAAEATGLALIATGVLR